MSQMSNVVCANCGATGHMYRACPQAICSFGVICFRLRVDFHAMAIRPEFLLVQRKDSLFFIEFTRGKYNTDDHEYIRKMVAGMTKAEQDLLRRAPPFSDLWQHVWSFSHMRNCMTAEFVNAREKYNSLMQRMPTDTPDVPGEPFLLHVLRTTPEHLPELEWGFPKGKKNPQEQEYACAMREFTEETGVPGNYLHVYGKTFEDSFVGTNNVNYRHVYYMGRLVQGGQSGSSDLPIRSAQQAREVSRVAWMTLKEGSQRLSGSRVALLEQAHRFVVSQIKGRW